MQSLLRRPAPPRPVAAHAAAGTAFYLAEAQREEFLHIGPPWTRDGRA